MRGRWNGPFHIFPFSLRRDRAVAVEIAEPLAVERIREMGVRPVVDHLVPARVFRLARQLPGQQRGDDRLVVRPPEFHVVPVLGAGQSPGVPIIEDPAVLLSQPISRDQSMIVVPRRTSRGSPFRSRASSRMNHPASIACPGTDHAALERVQNSPVGPTVSRTQRNSGFRKSRSISSIDCVDHLGRDRIVHRLAQLLGRDHEDHRHGQALHGAGRRDDLRRREARGRVVFQDQPKQLQGLLPGAVVFGRNSVGRQGDRRQTPRKTSSDASAAAGRPA